MARIRDAIEECYGDIARLHLKGMDFPEVLEQVVRERSGNLVKAINEYKLPEGLVDCSMLDGRPIDKKMAVWLALNIYINDLPTNLEKGYKDTLRAAVDYALEVCTSVGGIQ